jgi:hypothetical protein
MAVGVGQSTPLLLSEGVCVRDGIAAVDRVNVELSETTARLVDALVPIANDVVKLAAIPVDNGTDAAAGEDPVTKPVPTMDVKLRVLEAVIEAVTPVESGTGTDAVPSGALELTDGSMKPDEAVDAGAVFVGALEFTANGIVLEAAVPVGKNAVEFKGVLEMEPRRGPSDAEKFPTVDTEVGPVPTGAVRRGTEVTLED